MRSLVVYALAGLAIGAGLVVVVLCQPAMLLTPFSLPLYLIHLTAVAGGFAAGDVQELANSADKDGKTLLHLATARGYELMDKWLLTNGAIKSVNSADKDGKTPLYLATAGGYESIMELLFRNRAMKSVNLTDKDGKTPLYLATAGGNESIVKLLLRNGARRSVNLADKDGKTPLYLATAGGYESIVKLLLKKGATKSVNLVDKDGKTPLYLATAGGYKSIVKWLLKKGARKSVNLVDKDGKTLLHLATTEGYEPIKELLLQNGAKPSNHLIDRNGRDSPHLESEDHDDSSTDIQPGEVKKGGKSVSQTCSIGTLFWPSRLPKGITRIYWQCHCGYGSYDDYASRHHVIFAIQEKLKTSGLKVTISSQKLSLLSEFSMAARNIILGVFRRYSSSETSNSQINQRTPLASEHGGPSQGSTTCEELDITDGKNSEIAIISDPDRRKLKPALNQKPDPSARFLHLCLLEPGFGKLPQVPFMRQCKLKPLSDNGQPINSDQALFRKIRLLHEEACKNRLSGFLKLKGIYIVKFQLYRAAKISIMKENDVPHKSGEYEFSKYNDVDNGDPPISPSLMVHYYDAPEHAGNTEICLNAVPKRKSQYLTYDPSKATTGWGLYLKEEPSEAFFLLMKLALGGAMGVLIGIIWNILPGEEKPFPWSVVIFIISTIIVSLDFLKELIKAQYEVTVPKGK